MNYLLELASNFYPPDLCLLSSWDYRYESLRLEELKCLLSLLFLYNCRFTCNCGEIIHEPFTLFPSMVASYKEGCVTIE
jgi:hypothetical protein